MKKVILFLVSACVFLSFPLQAIAAEGGGIGLFPAEPDPKVPFSDSWFIYNLVAGESKDDKFIVRNTSDSAVRVKLYPVDATTTADGAFALRNESEERVDVGQWVTIEKDEVTVPAGGRQLVGFTVQIPKNAEVGDHIGGIIAEQFTERQEGEAIHVITRVGVRIYETVPGELKRILEITKMGYQLIASKVNRDKVSFEFALENKGNVHLDPKGKLTILSAFSGKVKDEFDIDLRTIFPGKPTEVPVLWEKTPLLGRFIARAKVTFGEGSGEVVEKELAFFYITKKAKIILAAAVLIIIVLIAAKVSREEKKKN